MIRERHTSAIERAIEVIERKLSAGEAPRADEAAAAAGFSLYHFHRVFAAVLGESMTQYIRRRRLSLCAARLINQSQPPPLVELAADAGFESQEAFTRAFKRMYGITPGVFRKRRGEGIFVKKDRTTLNMVLHMSQVMGLEPKIVEREAEYAVGIGAAFKEGMTEAIGQLWDQFLPRKKEIKGAKRGYALGVCAASHPEIEKPDGTNFVYAACLPVESENAESYASLPPGMVRWQLPRGRYAVFTHVGPLRNLPETISYIWGTWVPSGKHQLREGVPDFELYDDRFDPVSETGSFDIYIPIV